MNYKTWLWHQFLNFTPAKNMWSWDFLYFYHLFIYFISLYFLFHYIFFAFLELCTDRFAALSQFSHAEKIWGKTKVNENLWDQVKLKFIIARLTCVSIVIAAGVSGNTFALLNAIFWFQTHSKLEYFCIRTFFWLHLQKQIVCPPRKNQRTTFVSFVIWSALLKISKPSNYGNTRNGIVVLFRCDVFNTNIDLFGRMTEPVQFLKSNVARGALNW